MESTVPESAVGRHAAFDAGAFDVVDPGADEALVLFCYKVVEASAWESWVSGYLEGWGVVHVLVTAAASKIIELVQCRIVERIVKRSRMSA